MIKPKTTVTGAIGKMGSVVVTELLKDGYSVRAVVLAWLNAQGAEIVVADMCNVERVGHKRAPGRKT